METPEWVRVLDLDGHTSEISQDASRGPFCAASSATGTQITSISVAGSVWQGEQKVIQSGADCLLSESETGWAGIAVAVGNSVQVLGRTGQTQRLSLPSKPVGLVHFQGGNFLAALLSDGITFFGRGGGHRSYPLSAGQKALTSAEGGDILVVQSDTQLLLIRPGDGKIVQRIDKQLPGIYHTVITSAGWLIAGMDRRLWCWKFPSS
jgi:hypothetical protein